MPEMNYFKNKSIKIVKTDGSNNYIDKETSSESYEEMQSIDYSKNKIANSINKEMKESLLDILDDKIIGD
ncbi:hypothetical protein [Alkalithermobacter paradoxus]|uniref:Uncharacterized protein n=2 Tax=Alkalithermobacter paradoxus TaxID=29349 RepID=A0A1V4IBJ3_9FIRM|nr:hypothetical protein CLOTH_05890 [[Clostridium] thermoalcaliphilum]